MTPSNRISVAIKRTVAIVVTLARRAFGALMHLVVHDQLADIRNQTERLGSASVESITYVGGELNRLDERLTRIETELAALREALERGSSSPAEQSERAGEVASGPRSG
jgi:DNA-binding LacI/PurR family transcriptional regulator